MAVYLDGLHKLNSSGESGQLVRVMEHWEELTESFGWPYTTLSRLDVLMFEAECVWPCDERC